MMTGLIQHVTMLRAALRRLTAAPLSALLSILSIGIALSLPAGMYALLQSSESLVGQFASAPQLSVFLAPGIDRDESAKLRTRLLQHPQIAHADFIPREKALEQMKDSSGMRDLIEGLPHNPLPDAFVLQPKRTDAAALEKLRDELQKWPKVEHVQLDADWTHKLQAMLAVARTVVLLVAVLLGIALIAVTFNTIRLQILTKRDEIDVARLFGATNAFIRRPFLYFGLLQGLFGGLAAWLIVSGGLHFLNDALIALTSLYASDFRLSPLSFYDSLLLLSTSAALGWLGAWLSVFQHLRKTDLH
ncbi:MAG: permease-like cell division protein FtsX [Pseudomonadota bacterium]